MTREGFLLGRPKLDPEEKKRRAAERNKIWKAQNPDKVRATLRKAKTKRRVEDPEGLRQEQARYQAGYREKYPEKNAERKAKWARENAAQVAERKARWHSDRMKVDPNYALARKLRVRMGNAFNSQALRKSNNTLALTGCSIPELIAHLSARFTKDMTLENYGEWVIDHIVPVGAFDLHDPLHRVICFHYSNLQPLWRADNLRKVKRDKALIAAARLAQSRL